MCIRDRSGRLPTKPGSVVASRSAETLPVRGPPEYLGDIEDLQGGWRRCRLVKCPLLHPNSLVGRLAIFRASPNLAVSVPMARGTVPLMFSLIQTPSLASVPTAAPEPLPRLRDQQIRPDYPTRPGRMSGARCRYAFLCRPLAIRARRASGKPRARPLGHPPCPDRG